jgi:hypothetical protein
MQFGLSGCQQQQVLLLLLLLLLLLVRTGTSAGSTGECGPGLDDDALAAGDWTKPCQFPYCLLD